MVNCSEFLQHTFSNFDGELQLISTTQSYNLAVNCGKFYNTLLEFTWQIEVKFV